jgi:lipoate---protein ligase
VTLPGGWDVRRVLGDAGCLHQRPVPDHPGRLVWVLETVRPALVLGSTQSDELVDVEMARAFDVAVVRRRSGGGAVLVVPGNTVWIDVIVPAGDPLWDDDVARAALWLGKTWQAALGELGMHGTEVHDGPLACGPLGRLVCFATVGAGEVTLDGRKVVGVSQRRTRQAARFQAALYRDWDPRPLAGLLRLDEAVRATVRDAAVGTGRDGAEVVETFLRHLPA